MSCLAVTDKLKESVFKEDTLICEECYKDEQMDLQEYLYEREYACINGCCVCCGCSCL